MGRIRPSMARSIALLQVFSGALQILVYTVAQDCPLTLPTVEPEKCQRVTDVPICKDMPWNYTIFPNFRGHSSQTEANQELEHFRQLIEVNCSGAIVIFLCSIYAPFCSDDLPIEMFDDPPLRVLPPCKRLCQHVRDRCEPVFNQRAGGLPWPDQLNCDYYENNDLCFGPQEYLNEVTIPPNLLGPGGEPGTSDTGGNTGPSMPKRTYATSSILSKCYIEIHSQNQIWR